jgi:putative tricarboxylic transport membrane protein
VAIILVWPFIVKLIRRNRPALATAGVATPSAPEAPSGSSAHPDLPVHSESSARPEKKETP